MDNKKTVNKTTKKVAKKVVKKSVKKPLSVAKKKPVSPVKKAKVSTVSGSDMLKNPTKRSSDGSTNKSSNKKYAKLSDAIGFPLKKPLRCFNIFWSMGPMILAIICFVLVGASIGVGMANNSMSVALPLIILFAVLGFVAFVFALLGGVALLGYYVRIIQGIIKEDIRCLPEFKLKQDFMDGWLPFAYSFVLSIPISIIALITVMINQILYVIVMILLGFLMPILYIQFAENRSFKEGFDIGRAFNIVFADFGGYVIMWLKSILQMLVYLPMTLLLFFGIGAMKFGGLYLYADYYKVHAHKFEKNM